MYSFKNRVIAKTKIFYGLLGKSSFYKIKCLKLGVLLGVVFSLSVLTIGCAVKPWQREKFSYPVMQIGSDPMGEKMENQTLPVLDGSLGNLNSPAGGCGC